MATLITVSPDYGYVILAACSTFVLATVHGFNVGKYRKAAKQPYPICYASNEEAKTNEAAYLFNCAQRAHANFQENQPSALVSLLIAGIQYPKSAAVLGFAWTIGRYLYMIGYTNPAKKAGSGRYLGAPLYYPAMVGLLGLSIWTGVTMVMKTL